MNSGKSEYLKKRRKSLLIAVVSLAVFGAVLFVLSSFNEKMNIGIVSSGGLYNIPGKLKDSMDQEPGKSLNILEKPVMVEYSVDQNFKELKLKKSFKVGKRAVSNSVFYLKEHGSMLYSYDFVSDDENVLCRGVMKKGAELFFIYFCTDKRD